MKTFSISPYLKRHLATKKKPINVQLGHTSFTFCAFPLKPSNETIKGPQSYLSGHSLWYDTCGTFLHHPQSKGFFLSFFGGNQNLTIQTKGEVFFFFWFFTQNTKLNYIISNNFILGNQCAVSYCNKIWVFFLYTLWILQINQRLNLKWK